MKSQEFPFGRFGLSFGNSGQKISQLTRSDSPPKAELRNSKTMDSNPAPMVTIVVTGGSWPFGDFDRNRELGPGLKIQWTRKKRGHVEEKGHLT